MKYAFIAMLLGLATLVGAEPKTLEIQGKPALRILNTARDAGHKPDAQGQWRVEGSLELVRKSGKGFFDTSYSMTLRMGEKSYPVKRGSIELVDALAETWPSQSNEKGVWKISSKIELTADARNENETATLVLHAPDSKRDPSASP